MLFYKGANACDIKYKVLVVHIYTPLLFLYTVSKKLLLSYTVMHVLKPDLYTLTLLAGLTINSIVQQSRHVLQCIQAEKFTLEEMCVVRVS